LCWGGRVIGAAIGDDPRRVTKWRKRGKPIVAWSKRLKEAERFALWETRIQGGKQDTPSNRESVIQLKNDEARTSNEKRKKKRREKGLQKLKGTEEEIIYPRKLVAWTVQGGIG